MASCKKDFVIICTLSELFILFPPFFPFLVASGVVALRERHQAIPGARPKVPAPSKLTQSAAGQKIWVDQWEQTSIGPVSDLGENTHGHKEVAELVTGKRPFCVGGLREPPYKQGSDTQPRIIRSEMSVNTLRKEGFYLRIGQW